jgi:hypothetical protein
MEEIKQGKLHYTKRNKKYTAYELCYIQKKAEMHMEMWAW